VAGRTASTTPVRLPSESELVKAFGASRPTVNRALRELQLAGLIDRRAGSGSYVRADAGAHGYVFGLLIPELGRTEIFEPICRGMADAQHGSRHVLLVKYASLLPVPLTTVRQPCAEIGTMAIAAMLERLSHPKMPPRDVLLDFRLVVRASCGSRDR